MAEQLTDPAFIQSAQVTASLIPPHGDVQWQYYYWIYLFAFLLGFSTTIAEPH